MVRDLPAAGLEQLDPARPVYVEAESRKVGNLHVPERLMQQIRAGACLQIDATLPARVAFLLEDYDYFLSRQPLLQRRLRALQGLQSNDNLQRWNDYVEQGQWPALVQELLELHYDPLYHRSQNQNFTGLGSPARFACDDLTPAGVERLATRSANHIRSSKP